MTYVDEIQTLSDASVARHFDAFLDIPWDDPEYAIVPADPRWILSDADALGRHAWYKALPQDRQIEIGMRRMAQVCKVGLQFEQALVAGIMFTNVQRQNGRPEFRYSTHEATEETHHMQMFQEFVNRTGLDVSGGPRWFTKRIPLMTLAAAKTPVAFWMGVLAGEEPVDHVQKNVLRSSTPMHPLVERIMQIHVAEEARHISFAHAYLHDRVPKLNTSQRRWLGFVTPIVMRVIGDVIMRPSAYELRAMGVPADVAQEIWWEAPESRQFLRDLYSDVRMLCDDLGLRGPVNRWMWRRMRIDGRPARFRGEPRRAA